jgi:hypothetical protein
MPWFIAVPNQTLGIPDAKKTRPHFDVLALENETWAAGEQNEIVPAFMPCRLKGGLSIVPTSPR